MDKLPGETRSIHEQAERIRRAEAIEAPCTHYGFNEPRVRVCLDCYDAAIRAAEQRRDVLWREALIQQDTCGHSMWRYARGTQAPYFSPQTDACHFCAPLRALLASNASATKSPSATSVDTFTAVPETISVASQVPPSPAASEDRQTDRQDSTTSPLEKIGKSKPVAASELNQGEPK